MFDCIILGDSIAVGTQQFRPECIVYASTGVTSHRWNEKFKTRKLDSETVVISLGTNDNKHVKTDKELLELRAKIKAARVFWILPYGNTKAHEVDIQVIQIIVKDIAAQYGDVILPISKVRADKIHPTYAGYKHLAERTK